MTIAQDALELDEYQARALALAARHVNASTSVAIPDDVLARALQTGVVPPGYDFHVFAVLDETDTATLADLAISSVVGYGQLADLAERLLHEGHPTRAWLDARR